MLVHELQHPIVLAPLAGGPSTPALAAAVGEAGGLGFLAGGYLGADAMRADIRTLRERTSAPFGVNVFVPGSPDVDEEAVRAYVERLRARESGRYGVEPGAPRFDDDDWRPSCVCSPRRGSPSCRSPSAARGRRRSPLSRMPARRSG
jgi:nitronate monooxygenase